MNKKTKKFLSIKTIVLVGLILGLAFLLSQLRSPSSVQAAAGINEHINFQGKVVNANGTNVANGTYPFDFKIYTVSSGGATVWSELAKSLVVTDGVFQTSLGDATTLPGSINFNTDNIYLGVTFNNDAAGEMSPRVRFTAVPYAHNADTLDGVDSTAFASSSTAFIQGGNSFGASATLGTNDVQALLLETNNNVRVTILSGGNVGIGVSPTEKLDVNGNINIPDTSSTVGVIKQAGIRILHAAGGTTNIFLGANAGNLTQTGSYNTGIGIESLFNNTSGFFNTSIGGQALEANTTGAYNSALGVNSLTSNTTGAFNVAVGYQAGVTDVGANANVSGQGNTFLGFSSGPGSTTQLQNSTAIGRFSVVDQDNSLVLGCINGVNSCTATTKVGIGTSTPASTLSLGGTGGTAAEGILLGADTNIYRSSASNLKTDDNLIVVGTGQFGGVLYANGSIVVDLLDTTSPLLFGSAGDTNLYRSTANTLKTDDSVIIVGSLTLGAAGTAITQTRVYTPTFNPAAVAATTTAEQTFTVTGLATSDTVYINKPSHTTNCGIVNVRVSAANTLAITFNNAAAAVTCDPPSEVYRLVAIRS